MRALPKSKWRKDKIKEAAQAAASPILEGETDPIELWIDCKATIEYCKEIMSLIEEETANDLSKYPKEDRTFFGCNLSLVEGRKSYEYKKDPEYMEIFKKLKEREELIKIATNSAGFPTGAEFKSVSRVPIKYSKGSINVKL